MTIEITSTEAKFIQRSLTQMLEASEEQTTHHKHQFQVEGSFERALKSQHDLRFLLAKVATCV